MANLPAVVLIGRPNVGKSSLFNRLSGQRQAITHAEAGTTRDANYSDVDWTGHHFTLVDTAGVARAQDDIEVQSREQLQAAINAADLVVQVVDATAGVTDADLQAARLAHRSGKPHLTAINKVDANREVTIDDFRSLGTTDLVAVSALHGRGTGDLLDLVVGHIDKLPSGKPVDPGLSLALLGRPNVGKSSLVNTLLGKQAAVVSNTPGTTRDVNRTTIRYHGQSIELVDTAGIRRPGSIAKGVEQFSVLRTLASIKQADICALLIDATEPATTMDQRIAGMVADAGKGLILVMNKWDLIEGEEKDQGRVMKRLQRDFQFVWWAPVVFTSAETGLNAAKLFELTREIAERRKQTMQTGPLNRLLEDLIAKQPPVTTGKRQPKINYATQTDIAPPTITLFGSNLDSLHFSYRRFLENGLRDKYDLTGTPVVLETRSKPRRSAK